MLNEFDALAFKIATVPPTPKKRIRTNTDDYDKFNTATNPTRAIFRPHATLFSIGDTYQMFGAHLQNISVLMNRFIAIKVNYESIVKVFARLYVRTKKRKGKERNMFLHWDAGLISFLCVCHKKFNLDC